MTSQSCHTAYPSGELDIALRLLDHQILGPDGELLGKVEDLALRDTGGTLEVTDLLTGAEAWGRRLPGALGRWVLAVWRRLHPEELPGPTRTALDHLLSVDEEAHVSRAAAHELARSCGLEIWLDQHVVSRLPGGRHDPDTADDRRPRGAALRRRATDELDDDQHRLGELMSCTVVDEHGHQLGTVSDVRCRPVMDLPDRVGALRVVGLSVSHRGLGTALGYGSPDHPGPVLVARLVRRLHRQDSYVTWSEVARVDWHGRRVHVLAGAPLAHPLESLR